MPAPLMDTYNPPDLVFERGEGVRLTTTDGDTYLDFIAGISVNALGHSHPALVAALTEQAGKLWHLSNMYKVPGQTELAAAYCADTFADRVFFTNSGTEAIECALKMARRYHFANGAPERIKIIGFSGAFHGRSYGAINAGGNPKYLEGFGPALPGFVNLEFGDHDALHNEVDATTAAVILEPVQGEGGVRALPDVCLRGVRELTRERGALLIHDEVQCGAGRTGKLFAHQWAQGAEPDIMAVAKGVGGGFPMGACLAREEVGAVMVPGTHGSTFGGNPLAMAVGLAVWRELTAPGFLEHVEAVSNVLLQGLAQLQDAHPDQVLEVRGKGLLTGIKVAGSNVAVRDAARERGLLVGVAGDNVVRLAPPLIVTQQDVSQAIEALDAALGAVSTPQPA